jgi:molybdate-binding protein
MEDGSFAPNTSVALRLAQVLGVSVERIFSLADLDESEALEAELLSRASEPVNEGQLVRLCRVNGRLIAAPVPPFPPYLPRADGVISSKSAQRVSIRPTSDTTHNEKELLLAGCDPALSLLARGLESSGIKIVGIACSSRCALQWLKQQRVHAAGSHLVDSASSTYNVPVIQRLFPRGGVQIVTFAIWEQGLVLARGNPKRIRSIADLADKRIVLMNREKGSGSRDLLDKGLRKAGIRAKSVAGYKKLASGHLPAAYAVATGAADCCIATRSAARCFGLDFIPLAVERFDLSFSKTSLELTAAKALLNLLHSATFRRGLEAIAGYDTAHTGEVLA